MFKNQTQSRIKENFHRIVSPYDVLTKITPNLNKKKGISCPKCTSKSISYDDKLYICNNCKREFNIIDWIGISKFNDYDPDSTDDIHKVATLIIKKMKLSRRLIESLSIDINTALEINLLLRLYMGFTRKTYADLNRIIDAIDLNTLRRCIAYNPFNDDGKKQVSLAKYLFTYYTINRYYQPFISELKHMFRLNQKNRNTLIDQLKTI